MKLNKAMKEKIETIAKEHEIKINSSNFSYVVCDWITDELIDNLMQYDVSVKDVQIISILFQEKLFKLGVKKEEEVNK